MKTNFIILITVLILLFNCSCESNSDDKEYGSVLFYTNAQLMFNCGEFDVNVYIDGEKIGVLRKPFLPLGDVPNCDFKDSLSVLQLKMEEGEYNYSDDFYCSDSNFWSGEFSVSKDSCVRVFLDITELRNKDSELKEKLIGSWVELYPVDSMQTFIFTDYDSIYRINNLNNSKVSYFYQLKNDSITVTRNWEIEESIKTTKHRLLFYSSDTLEIKQFLATGVGITGFKDITLIKIDEL